MPIKKYPQNVLPLSPQPPTHQRIVDLSDVVTRIEPDGTTVEAKLAITSPVADVSVLMLKVEAFQDAIPATTLDGLEAWLMDLLRRTFAPKDAQPAA